MALFNVSANENYSTYYDLGFSSVKPSNVGYKNLLFKSSSVLLINLNRSFVPKSSYEIKIGIM